MSDESETFSPFDAADYLATFDDVAAYLEAVIDEGDDDPVLIAQALGAIARSGNVSELARRAGMSREGLSRCPGPWVSGCTSSPSPEEATSAALPHHSCGNVVRSARRSSSIAT